MGCGLPLRTRANCTEPANTGSSDRPVSRMKVDLRYQFSYTVESRTPMSEMEFVRHVRSSSQWLAIWLLRRLKPMDMSTADSFTCRRPLGSPLYLTLLTGVAGGKEYSQIRRHKVAGIIRNVSTGRRGRRWGRQQKRESTTVRRKMPALYCNVLLRGVLESLDCSFQCPSRAPPAVQQSDVTSFL